MIIIMHIINMYLLMMIINIIIAIKRFFACRCEESPQDAASEELELQSSSLRDPYRTLRRHSGAVSMAVPFG